MTYFNHIPEIIDKIHQMESKTIYVGVPTNNSFLTMVALVQEGGLNDDYSGTDIHAKNYPFLWIPTANAGGRKPGEIPGLYVRQRKDNTDSAAAGYDDPSQSYGFCVCFVLKKSIHIPARPFIRHTNIANHQIWANLMVKKMWQAAIGVIGVNDYFQIIGERITNDLKQTITEMSHPSNAPLTQERKGRDDPLEDTGKLRDSITWFVTN